MSQGKERRAGLPRADMVGWYDPGKLLQTGGEVLVSTVLGRHADRRLLESFLLHPNEIFDYTKDDQNNLREEITLDYLADTGDGWNSTYAVLYWISRPQLTLDDRIVHRGDILLMGGDQVYPTASREEYERRLVKPMEAALDWTDPPHPHIYAIPGNHDWYDSLVAFSRLFISRDWIAGWKSRQARSYFALKLPHRWWLVGIDVGLASDIDEPQLRYLEDVEKQMLKNDRVILCNAEPFWVTEQEYGRNDINLRFVEHLFGERIRVYLAGDLHHYRRHESPDGRQKITAGGGGAFLHPTHGWSKRPLGEFKLCELTFPPESASKRLAWRNMVFPMLNRKFGVLTAILYMLIAWSVMVDIGSSPIGLDQLKRVATVTLAGTLRSSVAAIWITLVLGGFIFFTETSSKWYRRIGGPMHGLAHILAVFCLGWGAERIAVLSGYAFRDIGFLIASGIVMLVGGFVVGPLLMGLYLFFSLNIFKRHRNEAFSALKIQDWKHFLRLHIDANGVLTIFPIGIERVPRKWKCNVSGGRGEPAWLPDDPKATEPRLIEKTHITV